MSDEPPSPADRRAVPTEPAERDGLTRLPWESALYASLRALEADLDACRKENAELHLTVSQLHARLNKARAWARTSQENWKLRQQAWHRERNELLKTLKNNHE